MSESETMSARWARFMNRLEARRATLMRLSTTFVGQPEPRTIGNFERGKQLIAGEFLFSGQLVVRPETSIWDLDATDTAFNQSLHGFEWLDDLASVGDTLARDRAQDWLWGWIARFGRGQGPGWEPNLTGHRLIRWIHHGLFLLSDQDTPSRDRFFSSLAQQVTFLSRRYHTARPGLDRFEALTGLISAGLALDGMEDHVAPAVTSLTAECRDQIDEHGAVASRNPEELLEIFTRLIWSHQALTEAGVEPHAEHVTAIERVAPVLRALRHTDGNLPRFHGGGRGIEGRLDFALANSGVRKRHEASLAMGYARLSGGRTSVIVDAAVPPDGEAAESAHASTLAFELTSGRRPVIVSCGSGLRFGPKWRLDCRATAAHSAPVLAEKSNAQFIPQGTARTLLVNGPTRVPNRRSQDFDGLEFECGHDGYVAEFGLMHARKLRMTFDGRKLTGEDILIATTPEHEQRFQDILPDHPPGGLPFALHFHLHPDVKAVIPRPDGVVQLTLKSGETWEFRSNDDVDCHLETSTYLDTTHLSPRATKQIVLSARTIKYAVRVRWSLAKTLDTPIGIRDLPPEASNPVTRIIP